MLVESGYQVYGLSRTQPVFSHELFTPIICDITDASALDRTLGLISEDMGANDNTRLASLINNAGYAQVGSIEDVPVDLVRKQFETNVFALLDITKKVIPIFKKQGEGKVINVGSVVGHFAGPLGGVYSASKHALEALNAAMRMELHRYGIKVIVVNPGLTDTDFHATAFTTIDGFKDASDYGRWYKQYARRHMQGIPAAAVARIISNIVSNPNPKPRYIVGGRERLVLLMRKLLPEGMFYSQVEGRAMKIDN
ncbi:MAG: SDR family NAD(P)-dependent oxidoreductase [Nitrososphaera sp.]|nr:SDR family NAD(P)-dependent oxidoreductase [Nitrososphaera sp.]